MLQQQGGHRRAGDLSVRVSRQEHLSSGPSERANKRDCQCETAADFSAAANGPGAALKAESSSASSRSISPAVRMALGPAPVET